MKVYKEKDENKCLTYSVARYFNLDPKRVPFFVGSPRWIEKLQRFFRRRGLKIQPYRFHKRLLSNKKKLYLVTGQSRASTAKNPLHPRAVHHAVLYRGKKPYYDCSKSNKFLKKPCWVWLVKKI